MFEISGRKALRTIICIIYIGVISAQNSGNGTQILMLKSTLLDSLYDKDIRPPAYVLLPGNTVVTESYTKPVEVKVTFELVSFFGLDEVSGIFQIYGVLSAYWQDGSE